MNAPYNVDNCGNVHYDRPAMEVYCTALWHLSEGRDVKFLYTCPHCKHRNQLDVASSVPDAILCPVCNTYSHIRVFGLRVLSLPSASASDKPRPAPEFSLKAAISTLRGQSIDTFRAALPKRILTLYDGTLKLYKCAERSADVMSLAKMLQLRICDDLEHSVLTLSPSEYRSLFKVLFPSHPKSNGGDSQLGDSHLGDSHSGDIHDR